MSTGRNPICPYCDGTVDVKPINYGKSFRCPNCQIELEVSRLYVQIGTWLSAAISAALCRSLHLRDGGFLSGFLILLFPKMFGCRFSSEVRCSNIVEPREEQVIFIAEVGAAAATFPSEKHLSIWVGVCPGDEESAEVNRSGRSPVAAGQPPYAAVKLKGSIFEILNRRYVLRMGHNQTIGIIAHKLCRLVWKILHRGRYEGRGPEVSRIEPTPSQSTIPA